MTTTHPVPLAPPSSRRAVGRTDAAPLVWSPPDPTRLTRLAQRFAAGVDPVGGTVGERQLHRDGGIEVWLLGWEPGHCSPLRDHGGAHGAFVVVAGTLTEAVAEPVGPVTDALRIRRYAAGSGRAFGGDHIHLLRNDGPGRVISVHTFTRPLRPAARYDLQGGVLVGLGAAGGWAGSTFR